jgi:c-di-GMP-binding flagellar brake protein YcgR
MSSGTTVDHQGAWRDRRQSPRIRVQGQLRADLRESHQSAPVRDLSAGGFAIESADRFEPGTLHHCDFQPSHGQPVALLVQVVRSDITPGEGTYVTGFRFSMIEADCRQRVNQLVDSVADGLGFGQATG